MANFYSFDFEFDSIASQNFGLKIVNFDDSGLYSGVGSSDPTIHTQKVLRQDKVYDLGVSQDQILSFPLIFASESPISGEDRNIISNWLFGRSSRKKLKIIQDDLNGAWFNVFLTKPEPYYIGNVNYGFKCVVQCDSAFAYSPQKTTTRTYFGNNVIVDNIVIYNASANDDYLYPDVSFELNAVGNSFEIINNDDVDMSSGSAVARSFYFSGLQANEIITIGGDTKTIVSSTGLHRLSNFNKKWFRLVPRTNHLHIESGIGTFTINYFERVKIGG